MKCLTLVLFVVSLIGVNSDGRLCLAFCFVMRLPCFKNMLIGRAKQFPFGHSLVLIVELVKKKWVDGPKKVKILLKILT